MTQAGDAGQHGPKTSSTPHSDKRQIDQLTWKFSTFPSQAATSKLLVRPSAIAEEVCYTMTAFPITGGAEVFGTDQVSIRSRSGLDEHSIGIEW